MSAVDLVRLRALYDADSEPWYGDAEYGYECVCGKTLYFAAELEPRGLCDDCKERLMTAVSALLNEVERMRAGVERLRPVFEAAKEMRRGHEGCITEPACGACFRCDFDRAVDAALAAEAKS